MGQFSCAQKEEVLARMHAFNYSGMKGRAHGNITRYVGSFVGRDFKAWAQMALFIAECISARHLILQHALGQYVCPSRSSAHAHARDACTCAVRSRVGWMAEVRLHAQRQRIQSHG